jgi:hypothetical protein
MKDHYHLVTITDGQRDAAAIMDVLRNIHAGKLRNDLRLLNFVREVPVSFGVTLENVATDWAEMTVHKNQAVAMTYDKYTLIKSSHFPHEFSVHAHISRSNPVSCKATLTRFAYAQIRADRRNAVRVQIRQGHVIEGTFSGPSGTISGNIVNISTGGIALRVQGKVAGELAESGLFSCFLPNGALEVPARLLKIDTIDDNSLVTFAIEAKRKMETMISQFIFSEQVEIIKTLKEQCL